ncbi:MAG: ATP-binding cassette domain-containing protein, partial [SAR324 cluster bacterium]|nr:ATP-binding cassette domain-containing protein [SAR324 cluster bacterium]
HRRVEALTADFGLAAVLLRRVSTYSGGFRQRLHVAIGMVHEPRLILLDEPTSELDPDACAFLWEVMRAYADRGHAVVVVTHDLEDVTRQCDRVALLSRGKVRLLGTPQDIIAQHGQATVEVTLDRPPDEWEPVSRRLASIAGVTHVELRNRQIVLRLDEDPDAEAAVSAVLRETQVGVSAYRQERPNLSSAYFHVTGQDMLEDPGNQPTPRRGGKGL